MTTESLQKLIHATPFQAFTLNLADGRTIRIGHRDYIAHRPGGRIAVVLDDNDGAEYLDLLLVVSAKVGPLEASSKR